MRPNYMIFFTAAIPTFPIWRYAILFGNLFPLIREVLMISQYLTQSYPASNKNPTTQPLVRFIQKHFDSQKTGNDNTSKNQIETNACRYCRMKEKKFTNSIEIKMNFNFTIYGLWNVIKCEKKKLHCSEWWESKK